MKFKTWSNEEIQNPKARTLAGKRYCSPIFAVYTFASEGGFLRPGAIGINRLHD